MKRGMLTALLAVLLATPACAGDRIIIALTGPFSGEFAPIGTSMRDGAKLAVAEINAAGGVKVGAKMMKFEVLERDDEANNERGALIARELASMKDLSGVIGTVNTGVCLAGDKYLQEKGITKIITPAAGSASMTQWSEAKVKDLSIFRFAANEGIQAAMVVEEAINRKYNKVALLHDSTNYGVSGRDNIIAQIRKQGVQLQVVASDSFNIGDKDMTVQLQRAKRAGAQAVLIWGAGSELAAVASGMAKVGLKVPLIGGWGLSMSSFIKNSAKNGNGSLMPQTFIERSITPKTKSFIVAYHKTYNVKRIPSPVSAAQGYDAVLIFASAVKQAQSTDTMKIKLALEDLKEPVQGVIATWKKPFSTWDPANEESHEAFRREQVVIGMVQDGRVVFGNNADRIRLIGNAPSVNEK